MIPFAALLQSATSSILDSTERLLLGGGGIIFVLLLVVGLGVFFASRYKRCPSDRLLVISGSTGVTNEAGESMPKVIAGGGAFVVPVLQEYAYLSLSPFTLKVELKDALSAETIRIAVPSAFTLAIGNTSPLKENAATRLLNKTEAQIISLATETIIGTLRQVVAVLTIQEINSNRDEFRRKIEATLVPELTKLGLTLLNVNIQDLRDESGYLDALGKKAGSEATQRALGDVAEAEKVGKIRVAEAQREELISVAEQHRQRDIGVQEANLLQAIRTAEISREVTVQASTQAAQQARETAALDQQRRVAVAEAEAAAVAGEQAAQAQQRIRIASTNADAVSGETAARALVAASESDLAVKQAEARLRAEAAKATAEGQIAEVTAKANTAASIAQGQQIEAAERARLEAPAKAVAATAIVAAEGAARQTVLAAQAEADANLARLTAEAQGQYAILSKRAQGIDELVKAAGSADDAFKLLMVEQLPALATIAAEAIKNIKIDKIMVWDTGNGVGGEGSGVSRVTRDLLRSIPPATELIEQLTGITIPGIGVVTPEMATNVASLVATKPVAGEGLSTSSKLTTSAASVASTN